MNRIARSAIIFSRRLDHVIKTNPASSPLAELINDASTHSSSLFSTTTSSSQHVSSTPLLLLSPLLSSSTSQSPHLHIKHTRHYAAQPRQSKIPPGAYTAPPGSSQGSNIRITMTSSNVIAEPYKGQLDRLPLVSWVTPSGWKQRWARWVSSFKSVYTLSKVKKNVPGWTLPSFKQEALDTYIAVNTALARGNITVLRQLCAPAIFTDMKRQIKSREDGGWKKLEWSMASPPRLDQIEVVHGRLIAADPKDDSTAFAQLTVRLRSGQVFAAYNAKGKLVAGDKDVELKVDDYWVLERPLKMQTSNRWRVAGRLNIAPKLDG